MEQIPLDSFRILGKRFGWEKSFNEIVDDDSNDIELFRETLKSSKARFVDSESEEIGDWDGSAQDIAKIWLQYFFFQMRINVKSAYLVKGISNRGIPKSAVQDHISHMNEMKALMEDLFITSTYAHIIFLFSHLYDEESHTSEDQFFDSLFEDQYLKCVKAAHEIALEQPLFSKKTVDFKEIENKLRITSKELFGDLWITSKEEE